MEAKTIVEKIGTSGRCADLEHALGPCKIADQTRDRSLIMERKLTIPQAAKSMGIGTTSLRRIIAEGRLPVLRLLKKILILESDVEAFLQESRVVVRQAEANSHRLSPLPEAIAHSRHLGPVA